MNLLLDKSTARTVDAQGFLHVSGCNISKAIVNPYRGAEIPDWQERGLSADKVYWLLRTPEELAKAAPTFNNLPLLDVHVGVGATDFQDPEIKCHIVGSTGTDAVWSDPYLQNSLVIWTAGAIAGIESKAQTQLSCAYRYELDMEPGEFNGQRYDGRMKNIVGNHVALVEEGRAGKDVIVADSAMMCDYIVHEPDHKDSDGNPAPWVVRSEKTKEVLWSGTSEEDAKSQLKRMHSFAEDCGPMGLVSILNKTKEYVEMNLKPGIEGERAKILDDCTSAIDNAIHHLLDFDGGVFEKQKNPAKSLSEDSIKPTDSKEALMGKTAKLTPRGQIVKGAITAFLAPKLAKDSALKAGELDALLKRVKPANYAAQINGIVGTVKDKFSSRLAKDAELDLEELGELLEHLGEVAEGEEELPMEDAPDAGARLMEILSKCNLPEEVLGQINDIILELSGNKPTADEELDESKKVGAEDEEGKNDAPAKDIPVTKPAMDAALKAMENATVARVQALFQAAEDVAPIIGKVNALAADSAASIYKLALDAKGVDTKGVEPSAYRALVAMLVKSAKVQESPVVAVDKAMVDDFNAKFPTVKNVKKL